MEFEKSLLEEVSIGDPHFLKTNLYVLNAHVSALEVLSSSVEVLDDDELEIFANALNNVLEAYITLPACQNKERAIVLGNNFSDFVRDDIKGRLRVVSSTMVN